MNHNQTVVLQINAPRIDLDQHTIVQSLLAEEVSVKVLVNTTESRQIFTDMYAGVILSGQLTVRMNEGTDQVFENGKFEPLENATLNKEVMEIINQYPQSQCVLVALIRQVDAQPKEQVIESSINNEQPQTLHQKLEQETGKPIDESKFNKILMSVQKVLTVKDQRYGNSALQPLQIFGGKAKAGSRIDEKLARVKNSEQLRKNDTFDLIGYLILTCVEKGWEDFSDQLD